MKKSLRQHVRSRLMLLIVSFSALPLYAGKPAPAPAAIPAASTFRCPDLVDPNSTCPVVELIPEGLRGDFGGMYSGDYLAGSKVGTWVDGHHAVHFVLLSAWSRYAEADFTTPASTNAGLGIQKVFEGKIDVDRVTVSGNTETVGGKLCAMATGESVLAQTWIQIGDDPDKWWTVFFDKIPYGGDYTTVTRTGIDTWTVHATAAQKGKLVWRGKARGSKDIDKGFYHMPFVLTVRATCP